MIVKGAEMETVEPSYEFRFDKARSFQDDVLRWLHEGEEQVAVVNSPTGSGKTAAFSELCRQQRKTLLIYPTNALLRQQKRVLEEDFGFDADILSGDELDQTGFERVEELLQYTSALKGDVILTNPDILQAVLQNTYFDIAQTAMEFFNHFDGVVYDEFHFYDEFEASGLLLQIKVITERVPDSKVVLSSATPDETLVETVDDVLDVDVARIESNYVNDGDVFRHDTEVSRSSESIWKAREEVTDILREATEMSGEGDEPHVAVVFNSAYYSNRFYSYLSDEDDELYKLTEKDNGYDTQQDEDVNPDEHPVLVTTKKGEVGLDYDIRTLVMEKPRTAESFVQRFGRAGRKSEAEVYLYRTDRLNWWCDEMEFPEFVERIYDSLDTQQTDSDRLLDLSGLRAAYAVRDRDRGYSEIEEDFADVPNYGKWMSFLITTEDVLGDDDGAFFEGYPQDLVNLFEFVDECAEALHGLRGRSLNYRIEYPRGDSTAVTSYDLLSAFHHYRIDEVHEDKVKLRPKNPEDRTQIRVTFPGYENQYRNWTGSLAEIEEEMRNWLGAKVSRADIAEETDVTEELVNYFLSLVGITRSALPSEIAYGSHEFEVRRTSIIPEVVPKDV